MERKAVLGLLLAGLLICTAAGCGSKVSKDNYDKVSTGMTLAEVQSILGSGTEESGGSAGVGGLTVSGKVYVWKDGDKTIRITFANDKVVSKTHTGL